MKLLTHNMLSCHIKGVKNGYPFKIDPVKVILNTVETMDAIHRTTQARLTDMSM